MILQRNSIKRGDWLLNVPLDSCHLVKLLNHPHQVGRLIANAPLFMYQLYINYILLSRITMSPLKPNPIVL